MLLHIIIKVQTTNFSENVFFFLAIVNTTVKLSASRTFSFFFASRTSNIALRTFEAAGHISRSVEALTSEVGWVQTPSLKDIQDDLGDRIG